MTSAVNDTIPADNTKVAKADLRQNFATIKAEITALQAATSFARQLAFKQLKKGT